MQSSQFETEVETPSPSVQILDYIQPPSVQIIENVDHMYAKSTQCDPSSMTQRDVSNMEVQLLDETGRLFIDEERSESNSSPNLIATLLTEGKSSSKSSSPIPRDNVAENGTRPCTHSSVEQSSECEFCRMTLGACTALKEQWTSPKCEFCCLTLRSYKDVEEHWKLHTEIPDTCYLCSPPLALLNTPEKYLEHIHAKHSSTVDSSQQNKYVYVKCNFCAFRVRRDLFMAHLLSECYMAPCPLCGDKLPRKSERIAHRKTHNNVMSRFHCECRRGFVTYDEFASHTCRSRSVTTVTCCSCNAVCSQVRDRSKGLNAGVDHFIECHTSNRRCLSCNTEPLETLREHVLIHLKETFEVITPKPVLSNCWPPELFQNTVQEILSPAITNRKKKERSDGVCQQMENDQGEDSVELLDSSSALAATSEDTPADDDILEYSTYQSSEDFSQTEASDSRDAASPSLLERQRQVLATLIDDLCPPPSVIVIENEAAMVREEREETPNAVPKSSVMDDGEDSVLIIRDMSKNPSSSNSAAPVVHTVNEGDDECMILDVIELPTGAVSHTVAATRERKYKCSMCSETFLRKSTCRYHEQHSHRNDIVSNLCNEAYGVPLDEDSLMYICQQCAVAFEDPQKARHHLCEHMKKGLAFPCERCSGICLTETNLREHQQKHDKGKLLYRCLICTPNRTYHDETTMYYHLHIDHGVPIIAFCKNCLLGSANMDRIFAHTMYRECSGGKWSNPRISRGTLLRSLGFAVASDLYFQPKDEVLHKQIQGTKGRFAIPTQCSHRSFITFGDAFTTCPEDPSRCFALVNQNRWHSHLCATNREAPGEMPSVLPDALIVRTAENLIDMLYVRFKSNAKTSQRFAELCVDSAPCTSSNSTPATASTTQSFPLVMRRQNRVPCPIAINHPPQNHFVQSGADQRVSLPVSTGSHQVWSDGDISSLGQPETNVSRSQYQGVCIFCRCRNVPMVYETVDRAYKAVHELCMKFRDVHPIAAQSLFSSINSFIRDAVNRRSDNCFFCFCRWHYAHESFDWSGHLVSSMLPSQINTRRLLENHQKGLIFPDPYCIALFSPSEVSSAGTTCAFSAPLYPVPLAPVVLQRCVVCNKVPASGPLSNAMNIEYMIPVPHDHAHRERWATHICQYLSDSLSEEIRTAFRLQQQPRLCLRHFNPRTVVMSDSGSITRTSSAANEPPVFNFEQFAKLNGEFSLACKRLLDAIERNQDSSTIGYMLKIVQDLVKCTDDKCNRALNNHTDILLHRYHQVPHKFVCSECFNINNVMTNEQDMVEHVIMEHCKERADNGVIPVYYALHCPLKNCSTVHTSVPAFRKHINHAHSGTVFDGVR
ncbi:hypothetical protein KIN20_032664 [Parelaphostrongylus tenuis]|uniref:C2H2-type domain-containing protein n=1 Tax=Parelaphostrongylus tenuis TaxID=148309 RepID=A0AAD5WI91_PARTN|nr:hypothetical protein KIN20_032664 [Parelaphostrongylus tenuis]